MKPEQKKRLIDQFIKDAVDNQEADPLKQETIFRALLTLGSLELIPRDGGVELKLTMKGSERKDLQLWNLEPGNLRRLLFNAAGLGDPKPGYVVYYMGKLLGEIFDVSESGTTLTINESNTGFPFSISIYDFERGPNGIEFGLPEDTSPEDRVPDGSYWVVNVLNPEDFFLAHVVTREGTDDVVVWDYTRQKHITYTRETFADSRFTRRLDPVDLDEEILEPGRKYWIYAADSNTFLRCTFERLGFEITSEDGTRSFIHSDRVSLIFHDTPDFKNG